MSAGPLRSVLAAIEEGAASVDAVAGRTGLSPDVVRAGIDHLVRLGALEAKELAIGCPAGGCGSCASGTRDGAAGCGADGPSSARSGPALITLSIPVRRPG